jgi:hypothetical protein
MTANPLHVALYCQGTFDYANPTNQQIDEMVAAAADINASGFGTVILGQWHVHEDGSIYYNDSPLDSVIQQLKVIPTALTLGGSVQRVTLDFGPFYQDYDHIAANLDTFKQTMAGVIAQTAINGFDWDLEDPPLGYDHYHDLLVDLTQWANSLVNTVPNLVTAPPYQFGSEPFWNGVINVTNANDAPGMAWWNLQTYGGADYASWVAGFTNQLPQLDAQSYIVPGYNIGNSWTATPQQVGAAIQQLYAKSPQLDGGFIWRYEDIANSGYTTSDYANAIINAVGGLAQTSDARPATLPRATA